MHTLHCMIFAGVLLLAPAHGCLAQDVSPIVGTWEGESLCTIRDSPCHDEHVIYKFKTASGKLSVDAFKLVSGEQQFMGTLDCDYRDPEKLLTCSAHTAKHDLWEFHLNSDDLTGTLVVDPGKTLYRKIHVKRLPKP
jgi:hypothetical protein